MKKILKDYHTYILLFIVVFLYFFLEGKPSYDDIWFSEVGSTMSLNEFIVFRYFNWTTRLIIEVVMILLLKLQNIVWTILSTLMVVLIYYSMQYLLWQNTRCKAIISYIGLILMILFVWLSPLSETGWYATTLNYLWPMAMFFYSMTLFRDIVNNDKVLMKKKVCGLLAIIFASNQEQVAALMFGYFVLSMVVYMWKYKKVSGELLGLGVAICLMLVFHVTGPGNVQRSISEINSWYPSYNSFSFGDKVFLGILSTISGIMCRNGAIIFLCTLLMALTVCWGSKCGVINKIIVFIPSLIIIFRLISDKLLSIQIYTRVYGSIQLFGNTVQKADLYSVNALITIIMGVLYFGVYAYSIWLLFGKRVIFSYIVLASILCSRIMMGFSPTVFASGDRTFLFVYIGMIFLLLESVCKVFAEKEWIYDTTNKWTVIQKCSIIQKIYDKK